MCSTSCLILVPILFVRHQEVKFSYVLFNISSVFFRHILVLISSVSSFLTFSSSDNPLYQSIFFVTFLHFLNNSDLVKSVQIQNFFWCVFFCIGTKYGSEKTPYLDTFHTVTVHPLPFIFFLFFIVLFCLGIVS